MVVDNIQQTDMPFNYTIQNFDGIIKSYENYNQVFNTEDRTWH